MGKHEHFLVYDAYFSQIFYNFLIFLVSAILIIVLLLNVNLNIKISYRLHEN
jgi:hypothetical protein